MNLRSKKNYLFLLFFFISLVGFNLQAQQIKWLSFEEAVAKSKENPKKIIIDLYTDWCKWCKVMDEKTFAHPVIAKYINDNFYAVKFNAESNKPINFAGHKFENKNGGSRSPHDLAVALTQGKLSYPTYVFMDEKNQIIHVQPGFIEPKQFEPMITYISDGVYAKGTAYDVFMNSFKSNIK